MVTVSLPESCLASRLFRLALVKRSREAKMLLPTSRLLTACAAAISKAIFVVCCLFFWSIGDRVRVEDYEIKSEMAVV